MEEEANQLYRRPQMTGQAEEYEYEAVFCSMFRLPLPGGVYYPSRSIHVIESGDNYTFIVI